jgi:hypothetical protein
MTSRFASRLVRGWVALYTRGLPAEVRVARGDEIESDLWSQCEEAGSTGRSDSGLGVEILVRLVLGIAADITWRLERGRVANRSIKRSSTTGTRIVALLAIAGGLGFTVAMAGWTASTLAQPGARPWEEAGGTIMALTGEASIVALCVSLGGLGFVLLYRFDSPVGLMAEIGAAGGVMGILGAYSALAVMPVGSAVVVLYLARIHAVPWWLAVIHLASAPGFVLGLAAYSNDALLGIAFSVILVYSMTWIAIGLELLRGFPQPLPVTPSAT